ncbi:Gfo/Idh/MocA family oxidoreductase [Kribbella sp. NPDC051952]|uniref:Gfo/Idh/MocA family protein n=1 Tax=Kribbella sp. NPDC051952 TaxID=3154851 RepID=UPI00343DA69F
MTVHKIALVGAGNISRTHLTSYANHTDRVEVVAAADPLAERREWVRDTFGVQRTYETVGEMIEAGGWDVAVVCTPSHVRTSAVLELAAAGKHIFVEKPLSFDFDDARSIVDACAAAGVQLAVNQNFRDSYAFGLGRELIEQGEIGDVLAISQQELMFRQDKGWRLTQERHALSVMGIHWFDGFRLLLGKEATWLSARTFSSPAVDAAGETDASVQIFFGDTPVTYVQSFSSRLDRTETVVFGSAGTLQLGYAEAQLHRDGETKTIPNPLVGSGRSEAMFLGLDRLLTAAETGVEAPNSGGDNLRTIALLDGAYRSADSGAPIELKDGLPW